MESTLAFIAGTLIVAYIALCPWMCKRHVWWFTYFAYFFLFSAFVAMLMFFFAKLHCLSTIAILLIFGQVIASQISMFILCFKKEKSCFEKWHCGLCIGSQLFIVVLVKLLL